MSLKKIIIAVAGLVVLGELIWAGSTLIKPAVKSEVKTTPKVTTNPSTLEKPTILSLQSAISTIKVGEKIAVSINISSYRPTDGSDIIIFYDPSKLSVEADPQTKKPVVASNLYNDYPQNVFDAAKGRITVSGISTKQGGTIANGLFGTINFKAKTAGQTKVTLEFTGKGNTVDSNVIDSKTAKDILDKVQDLNLNITK